MPTSSTALPATPSTVWLARGRHTGPAPAQELLENLQRLKDEGGIQDFMELSEDERPPDLRVFEARWLVPDEVTVRARLELARTTGRPQEHTWTLVAEAEGPWGRRWPSPATRFWPAETGAGADGGWDHAPGPGLRFRHVNPLPDDDKELRRVLRGALRDDWNVHLVVHEAMTPDARGRKPLVRFLPPGLRDRVVEHRAAPHQLRAVNWALRDSGAEVPRGGAVVLPGTTGALDAGAADAAGFAVRTVFLDGSEPSELVEAVSRFAAAVKPLPEGAGEVLTALREEWHLLTVEEELARQRQLVAMYAEALEAMTRSRDLYRDAAEQAHEALAVYREHAETPLFPPRGEEPQPAVRSGGSPFQQLTRTLERLRDSAKSLRPAPDGKVTAAPHDAGPAGDPEPSAQQR
ncbi:hypothetical protein ACWEVY_14595 [Streptomyces longwoodensis]